MRLLLVSDHYPPYIGGAHRQTQLLGRELHKRGHEVSVVTAWQPGLPATQDDHGVTVYRLRELRTVIPWLIKDRKQRHHPPYPDPVTAWGLRRVIQRLKPDVVHAHGWFSYSCAMALLGKSIPFIISCRDYGYICSTRTLLYQGELCNGPAPLKCLSCATSTYGGLKGSVATISVFSGRKLLLRKVTAIHTVSEFVRSIIRRELLRDNEAGLVDQHKRIHTKAIASFLITDDASRPDEGLLSQLPNRPFILYVGGLQMRKGLASLIEAYNLLIDPPPLVLVGYRAEDTPREFPSNVIVLHDASHATVMEAWRRSYFGVVPSLWPDPSPGVVREAMLNGKAVIGTDIGGTSEMIVSGVTGLLVPPGDAAALASAMGQLIANPALCQRMGQVAQERAAVYMASVSVPEFERLYYQAIDSRQITSEHQSFPTKG